MNGGPMENVTDQYSAHAAPELPVIPRSAPSLSPGTKCPCDMPEISAHTRDLVVGITPFCEPNADLVVAIERAGHLGVLDLGPDATAARTALNRGRSRWGRPFGVRIAASSPLSPADLPAEVDTVIIDPDVSAEIWRDAAERVLAEVTSHEEALQAARRGAHGLVARGFEAGGRIGDLSTFVLVQRLVAELDLPVWAMGGIGEHTAAAAVAGGARGVVLDAQLALVAEAGLPADVAAAIAAMDGSETIVTGGHRVYARPDLPVIDPEPGNFGARSLREQLRALGGADLAPARVPGSGRDAGVVRRRGERRAVGSHGRGDGGTAGRARRPGGRADGHRVPVHRGGCAVRRDPGRVPADRPRVRGHSPAGDLTRPCGPVRRHALRDKLRRGPAAARREGGRGGGWGGVSAGGVGRARTAQPRAAAHRREGAPS